VTYPGWLVSDVSADGTRLLAKNSSTNEVSIIDAEGRVIRSTKLIPASNLAGDGRTWVSSAGEIVTDGVVRSTICPDDPHASIRGARVDRTASNIVFIARCWRSGLDGIYLLKGGTLKRLASNSEIIATISADGSSVFLNGGGILGGVYINPVR
jgi:hypothetical protein